MMSLPRVSIILINYNELENLKRCLPSLYAQDYPDFEVIVVDNGATDGSTAYVRAEFPQVKVVEAGENLGFAGGNNLGAQHADGKYLAFLNPDTTVEPDWLQPLVQTLEDNPDIGATTAKVLILDQPEQINTCGNDVHYAGFGYLRGWMQHTDTMNKDEIVCSVSGAAFVMAKSLFEHLGGFDHNFFPIYVEDTDLSWRLWLAGYKCQYVHESAIYHDYTAGFGDNKYYRLERNRYQMIFKTFKWPTLLLLIPALLLSEVVSWGYGVMAGTKHMKAKLRSYGWLLSHIGLLLKSRAKTQSIRKVPDRVLLKQCTHKLDYGQANEGLPGLVANIVFTPLFFLWYQFCVLVVRW